MVEELCKMVFQRKKKTLINIFICPSIPAEIVILLTTEISLRHGSF